jgi:hypothetical protein
MDKELIGRLFPPPGGFWELGGFEGENLWISGTNLAPFDQRVDNAINYLINNKNISLLFCYNGSSISCSMSLLAEISFLTVAKMKITTNRGTHLTLLK